VAKKSLRGEIKAGDVVEISALEIRAELENWD
jgi:hypothetical protein